MKKIYSLLLLAGICLFGAQNVMADIVYPTGTVITFDATAYGGGMNIYLASIATSEPAADGNWFGTTESVITFTLTSDFNASTWGNLFRSEGSNWQDVPMVVPASTAYTIIRVNAEGNGFTWEMPTTPVVGLSVQPFAIQNEEITLIADAENFSGEASFSYSYSIDGENFTPIATTTSTTQAFTVSETEGTYTFKVVASYNTEVASSTSVCKIVSVCTVAGTENFFGSDWNAADTNNDMTGIEGVYTWTKSGYLSSSMNIKFKVAINHAWDASYPASNVEKTLGVGYHNVTISFDWSSKEVTFEDVTYPKIEVAGDFNEWVLEELTYSPSGYLYKNIPVTTGNKAFKLKINDAWQGNSGTMTRTNCENWTFGANDDCHLLADVEGNYTFFFQNGKLSVSYPESFTRAAANDNYQSLCVPFDATISNAKAYKIASVGTDYVSLEEKTDLVAGNSYIIKPESVGDIVISKVSDGYEVDAPVDDAIHFGVLSGEITVNPNFDPEYPDIYILKDNKLCRLESEAHATVTAGHAFFKLTLPTGGAPALRIVVAENEATAIENIEDSETAVKFIENGKLFIRKNGVVYDATGAIVK